MFRIKEKEEQEQEQEDCKALIQSFYILGSHHQCMSNFPFLGAFCIVIIFLLVFLAGMQQ
jgi:hypothetical protein